MSKTAVAPTPTVFGFYWAKMLKIDPGHPDFKDIPFEARTDFEVVELVENCLDETNREYRKVQVLGMSQWQSPENFQWGPMIPIPAELSK